MTGVGGDFSDIMLNGDSISADVKNFRVKDQSGFQVNDLTAAFRMTPTGIALKDFVMKTLGSEIHSDANLQFKSFDAFNDFASKVTMEATLGKSTSGVEVTNISGHGFWLLMADEELFVAFKEFPWFKDASVSEILNVEWPQPHLRTRLPSRFSFMSRTGGGCSYLVTTSRACSVGIRSGHRRSCPSTRSWTRRSMLIRSAAVYSSTRKR